MTKSKFQLPNIFSSFLLLILWLCLASIPTTAQQGKWVKIDSSYGTAFRSITCLDDEHCIVCGDSAIQGLSFARRTTDGGKSWTTLLYDTLSLIPLPQGDEVFQFHQAAYPTLSTIFIIGDSGLVFRTKNSGQSWDSVRLPIENSPGKNGTIVMHDSIHGYVVAGSKIFRTVDGGNNWQPVVVPDSVKGFSIGAVIPISSDTIFFLMNKGLPVVAKMFLRTYDGGKTWDAHSSPELKQITTGAIDFPDAQYGFAAGYERTGKADNALDLHTKTTDGGKTWTPLQKLWRDPALGLFDISFLDRRNGIATGGQGKIVRTTDGGETWVQQQTPLDTHSIVNINSLAFPSLNTAYVSGWQFLLRWYPEQSDVSTEIDASTLAAEPLSVGIVNNQPVISATMKSPGAVRFEVVTVMGEKILEEQIGFVDAGVLHHPLSSRLPAGKYFVQLFVDQNLLGSTGFTVVR
ncbi:MAG: hypothetical protein IPM61_13125 [Chlorobi bacterium]|nr:hypothetical protein [Chlorobiota bacterium]MBX7215975.1 hypothetical protein [Candidatus Kapabacteria bacterium]